MKMVARGAWVAGLAVAACLAGAGVSQAGEPTAPAEHRVRKGDNLHLIAGYYYKDPRQWKRIYAANRRAIRNASLVRPGQVLAIDAEPGRGWDIPYEEFVARVHRK